MNELIQAPSDVARIAGAIRRAGAFALDLEFVSESRYVPELGLVQVAWGASEAPSVAAIDPLAVDPRPVVELVADAEVTTVLHAAQGDLGLLAARFEIEARGVVDTQIAAGFLGLGEQIGYTRLLAHLFDLSLDKAAQFTDWLRRPLSDEQLRYAIDDVRHLLAAWRELAARLAEAGRLAWVEEESARLAREAAERPPSSEAFRRLRGWERLRPRQLGVLRSVAAWRQETALATNRPPAWIVKDRALVELAQRPPRDERDLAAVRGVGEATVRRYGREILEALAAGRAEPLSAERGRRPLPEQAQTWAVLVGGLVQARCRELGLPVRFVATRGEAEELARWWLEGDRSREPDLPLLRGWRRELAGERVLAWLAGRMAIAAASDEPGGIRLVETDRIAG